MVGALSVIHNNFLQGNPPRRNHLGNRFQIHIQQEARTHSAKYVFKRSNELAANMPVIVEPLEVPSSSEPAPMERIVPDVVHPVQYGIVPRTNYLTAPRR